MDSNTNNFSPPKGNLTGDAHPVHLHLVHFQVVGRFNVPAVTLVDQPVVQHNGMIGQGFKVQNPGSLSRGSLASVGGEYVETGPMDVVTALPGQITVIRAKFDKPGRCKSLPVLNAMVIQIVGSRFSSSLCRCVALSHSLPRGPRDDARLRSEIELCTSAPAPKK